MINFRQHALETQQQTGFRAVNAKFPPIALFDDVADADEFGALYALQARTNPRLQNEVGRIELIARGEIPFGIIGCSDAVAPFTHVNRDGSRFSDGRYGVLYIADGIDTALAEVAYHQGRYWSRVEGLRYDRVVLRGLRCIFGLANVVDISALPENDPVYDPDDYQASREFGRSVRTAEYSGIQYRSVRSPGNLCWGLLTPRRVRAITQARQYEMIWNGQRIAAINEVGEGLTRR